MTEKNIKNFYYYNPDLWFYLSRVDFIKVAPYNILRYTACINLKPEYNLERLEALLVEFKETPLLPEKGLNKWVSDIANLHVYMPEEKDFKYLGPDVNFNKDRLTLDFYYFVLRLLLNKYQYDLGNKPGRPPTNMLKNVFAYDIEVTPLLKEIQKMDYFIFLSQIPPVVEGLERISVWSGKEDVRMEGAKIAFIKMIGFYSEVYQHYMSLPGNKLLDKAKIDLFLKSKLKYGKVSLNTNLNLLAVLLNVIHLFALFRYNSLANIYNVIQTSLTNVYNVIQTSLNPIMVNVNPTEVIISNILLSPRLSFFNLNELLSEVLFGYEYANEQNKSLIEVKLNNALTRWAPALINAEFPTTYEVILDMFLTSCKKYLGRAHDEFRLENVQMKRKRDELQQIVNRCYSYRNQMYILFWKERATHLYTSLNLAQKNKTKELDQMRNEMLAYCFSQLINLSQPLVRFTSSMYATIAEDLPSELREEKGKIWESIKKDYIDVDRSLVHNISRDGRIFERKLKRKHLEQEEKLEKMVSDSKNMFDKYPQGSAPNARVLKTHSELSNQLEAWREGARNRIKAQRERSKLRSQAKVGEQESQDYDQYLKDPSKVLKENDLSLKDFERVIECLYEERYDPWDYSDLTIYKYDPYTLQRREALFKLKRIPLKAISFWVLKLEILERRIRNNAILAPKVMSYSSAKALNEMMFVISKFLQENRNFLKKDIEIHKMVLHFCYAHLYKLIIRYKEDIRFMREEHQKQEQLREQKKKQQEALLQEKQLLLKKNKEAKELLRTIRSIISIITFKLFTRYEFDEEYFLHTLVIITDSEQRSINIPMWFDAPERKLFSYSKELIELVVEKGNGWEKNIPTLLGAIFYKLFKLGRSLPQLRKMKQKIEHLDNKELFERRSSNSKYVDIAEELHYFAQKVKRVDVSFVTPQYQDALRILYVFSYSDVLFEDRIMADKVLYNLAVEGFYYVLLPYIEEGVGFLSATLGADVFKTNLESLYTEDSLNSTEFPRIHKVLKNLSLGKKATSQQSNNILLPAVNLETSVPQLTSPINLNLESSAKEVKVLNKDETFLQSLEPFSVDKKAEAINIYLFEKIVDKMKLRGCFTDHQLRSLIIEEMSRDVTTILWILNSHEERTNPSNVSITMIKLNESEALTPPKMEVRSIIRKHMNAIIVYSNYLKMLDPSGSKPLDYDVIDEDKYNFFYKNPMWLTQEEVDAIKKEEGNNKPIKSILPQNTIEHMKYFLRSIIHEMSFRPSSKRDYRSSSKRDDRSSTNRDYRSLWDYPPRTGKESGIGSSQNTPVLYINRHLYQYVLDLYQKIKDHLSPEKIPLTTDRTEVQRYVRIRLFEIIWWESNITQWRVYEKDRVCYYDTSFNKILHVYASHFHAYEYTSGQEMIIMIATIISLIQHETINTSIDKIYDGIKDMINNTTLFQRLSNNFVERVAEGHIHLQFPLDVQLMNKNASSLQDSLDHYKK